MTKNFARFNNTSWPDIRILINICSTFFLLILSSPLATQNVDSLRASLFHSKGETKVDQLNKLGIALSFNSPSEFEEGLRLATEIEYVRGIADSNTNLGIYYSYFGEDEKTEYHLQRAIEIFERINCICEDHLYALDAFATLKHDKRQYREAIDYAVRMSNIAEQYGMIEFLVNAEQTLAEVYGSIQYHEKDYVHSKKALKFAGNLDNPDLLAETEFSMGAYFLEADQLDSAIYFYQKSLAQLESSEKFGHQSYFVPAIWGDLAFIHLKKGKYEEAVEVAMKNLKRQEDVNNERLIIKDISTIATANLHLSQLLQAQLYAQKGIDLGVDLLEYEYLSELHDVQRSIAEIKGNFSNYLIHNKAYEKYKDSSSSAERIKQIAGLKARYDIEKEQELNVILKDRNELLSTKYFQAIIAAISLLLIALVFSFLFYRIRNQKRTIEKQSNELSILNAAKNRLFAIIGHDLRGPLFSLQGLEDQISYLLETQQMDRLKQLSNNIDKSVQYLTDTLNNLLNWSMHQMGKFPYRPESVFIKEIVEDVCGLFRNNAIAKTVKLEIDIPDGDQVYVDRNAISTILRNLMSNAIKFTSKGGIVLVSGSTENGMVKLSVSDNGIGMSSTQVDQIMSGFTVNRNIGTKGEKGNGLGLTLVNDLIVQNKGKWSVQSQKAKGSTFEIRLPITA